MSINNNNNNSNVTTLQRKPNIPTQSSILRSVQKDQLYTNWFKNENNLLFQKILGPRKWIQWKQEIDALSDFVYYASTTLNGLQTLGEEYVRIVQIQGNQLKLPSLKRRFLMVIFQTAGPIIIESLIRRASDLINQIPQTSPAILYEQVDGNVIHQKVAQLLPLLQESLTLSQRAHVVLFYFLGSHYELSKRLTNINYTAIRAWMSSNSSESTYKLLGLLTLSQLIISILLRYWNNSNSPSRPSTPPLEVTPVEPENKLESNEPLDPRDKCTLCLDERRNSTATPCGHLFCWDCIHGWLEAKEECPLCRRKFEPSRLVYLHN